MNKLTAVSSDYAATSRGAILSLQTQRTEANMQLNELMQVRVPEGFRAEIKSASDELLISSAAFVREAIVERLKRDGAASKEVRNAHSR